MGSVVSTTLSVGFEMLMACSSALSSNDKTLTIQYRLVSLKDRYK